MIDVLQRACAARRDVIGFAGGLPDVRLFPRRALGDALRAVVRGRELRAFQYGWPEGDERLRGWVARRFSTPAHPFSAEDVIVTAGAQQAFALAVDVLAPRRVGVGRATYPVALALLRSRGIEAVDGLDVDAHYVMPEIANPDGLPLDPELAGSMAAGRAAILADDAYAELRFDGAPRSRGDAFAQRWQILTFSKTLCPGLRIGCVVPPPNARRRLLQLKHLADLQASGLGQAVLGELLRRFDYDAHLRRCRGVYARRAERLARALRRRLPSWRFRDPEGGFSIFVDTSTPGDDVSLLATASKHGVSFDPGRLFRAHATETLELRLCYSSVPDEWIDEGIARLARAYYTARTPRR